MIRTDKPAIFERDTGLITEKSPGFLSRNRLEKAETWLWQKVNQASQRNVKSSRLRIWFIFMFLRYGALRLEEIFDLGTDSLNLEAATLYPCRKGRKREVPLPFPVARRLRLGLTAWPEHAGLERPFRCDSSFVRRMLARCGEESAESAFTLNVRSLRKYRQLELVRNGLDPDLLALFLGRAASVLVADPLTCLAAIRQCVHGESLLKSSARNTFYGEVLSIHVDGILVHVLLECAGGLEVSAIITGTSRLGLRLERGSLAMALVKAPWVRILPPGTACEGINCYAGIIEDIRRDGRACEIIVRLPQGQLLCALYAGNDQPAYALAPGSEVLACFDPFSVILVAQQ